MSDKIDFATISPRIIACGKQSLTCNAQDGAHTTITIGETMTHTQYPVLLCPLGVWSGYEQWGFTVGSRTTSTFTLSVWNKSDYQGTGTFFWAVINAAV